MTTIDTDTRMIVAGIVLGPYALGLVDFEGSRSAPSQSGDSTTRREGDRELVVDLEAMR